MNHLRVKNKMEKSVAIKQIFNKGLDTIEYSTQWWKKCGLPKFTKEPYVLLDSKLKRKNHLCIEMVLFLVISYFSSFEKTFADSISWFFWKNSVFKYERKKTNIHQIVHMGLKNDCHIFSRSSWNHIAFCANISLVWVFKFI